MDRLLGMSGQRETLCEGLCTARRSVSCRDLKAGQRALRSGEISSKADVPISEAL